MSRPSNSLRRIALLVADGPGVRNFLLGSFLKEANERAELTVLHPIPDNLLARYRGDSGAAIEWVPLTPFREHAASFVLRNTLAYAHLYWGDTGGMRFNRSLPIRGSWKTRLATRAARAAGRASARPAAMRALDRWHSAAIARGADTAPYRRLFAATRPSVLFCSNQRATIALPAVAAARQLGIPTAAFIFSWDNITSKGRIVAPFDHYLVWSARMRDELLRFYPHVRPDRVHVVGTPQFDPHADPRLAWSREQFVFRIGGDPARPLICYSGGDPTLYTAEHEYVRLLMAQIRSGRIHGAPQVVLRPSPADDGRQYEAVRREFPELLYSSPSWVQTQPGEWSRTLPLPDDVPLLTNLTRHADVNVNLNSTMTLDFALHDRPVVNLAFDLVSPPPFGQPLWDFFYQFEHYHPVIEFGAARFARTPDELADAINAYLENPALDRAGRRQFAELEVGVAPGASTAAVLDALASIAAGRPASAEPRAVVAASA